MVPETFLRTWNKEILTVFIPIFPIIFVSNGSAFCLLAPMVPGTDVNGTWYRAFRYLVLPLWYLGTFYLSPSSYQ